MSYQRRMSAPYTTEGPLMVRRNPGRKARGATPTHCPPGKLITLSRIYYIALRSLWALIETCFRLKRDLFIGAMVYFPDSDLTLP